MSGPLIVHRSDACTLAEDGDLLLQHWHGSAHHADVLASFQAHQRMIAKLPERKVWMLAVADAPPGLPDERTRRAFADTAKNTADQVHAQAIVIRAKGFMAAAVRSLVTTSFALTAGSHPRKVFADTDRAAEWLCQARGGSSSAILRAFREIELAAPAGPG